MEIDNLFQAHIIWFLIGVVFLLLELGIPGLFVVFFGAGAIVTAIASYIFDLSIDMQIIIFVASSALLLVLLRRWLKRKFFDADSKKSNVLEDEFIGKKVVAETSFKKGQKGKVEFNGTSWSAICDADVKKDEILRITEKESITFIVTHA